MWRVKRENDGIIQHNFTKMKAKISFAFHDLWSWVQNIGEGVTDFSVNLDESIVKIRKGVAT